jgi:hypothetical protein
MAVTRIKNNQIFDKTITYQKIADATLVGTLFNPNLTLNSNITVVGNLSVMGESSTISSTNTYVNDPLVVFNNGYTGVPTYDVGMVINRNLNPYNTAWIWNESAQCFEALFTTESGGTVGVINNSGYAGVKAGNLIATMSATVGNISMSGSTITTTQTDSNLVLDPNGTGAVAFTASALPSADSTYNVGSAALRFANVYGRTINVAGATITTNVGNDLLITPAGGKTIIANLDIAGTGSTFTGNIVSGNITIVGGTINGVPIGNVAPSTGEFTSIVDTGPLTANGANAAISFQPTGTGSVTINPATTGSISNMAGSFTTLASSGATTLAATSATSLTTANAVITGGTESGVTITNSPISGSTGSFTTLAASGATTVAAVTASGVVTGTDTTQSTSPTTGALKVAGGVGVVKNVNVGGNLTVAESSTLGNIVVASNSISSTGNVEISATGSVKVGALVMPQADGSAGSVMVTDGAGNLTLQSVGAATSGNVIPLGTPTVGTLVDNNPAIATFTTATKVTDAVDQLNEILGKLVPPQPPVFPNATTIAISGLPASSLRMTNFTQTDNTATQGRSISGGSTITSYKRVNTYSTNVINDVGPGSSGDVKVMKNGVAAGTHTMVESFAGANNGTTGDLIISDNADYSTKFVPARALLFWTSFDAQASGTVAQGWNEVAMTDTAGSATNTVAWYYDASAPGTPVVTSSTFAPTTAVTAYSASVPHYTSTTVWTGTGTATRLSGDLYPASDTFLTGTAGGSFQAPASVTYAAAGVTTPLARNLYVSSGNATFSTTVNTVNATGSSSTGPSYSVANSYATGSGTASPGGTVLTIKANDTAVVDENYIVVGTFGTGGSSTAVRVGGLATGATPTNSTATTWVSSAALAAYEATVVAGVAKQDTTNYSTGYFPVGPNLSSGRSATQYITFRIQRDATSKFDIKFSGKVTGCKVAMPGSGLDTTAAPTNGWIDPAVSYGGAGVPGTGTGGNGSAGCGLGGTLTTGATVTNLSTTVTFGTVSSNSSTNNYIYVRFALASGDSITALSFPNATN